ncbi:unnamed protein product [Mytilus coruscus]|uniref:Uncharacterized protein n=1 Tax=Mytilus coruscus TaxID=42192 RepID=A0A6J8B8Y4_MYTCO|nr:unnamed protein product [Mytilus coruscus]
MSLMSNVDQDQVSYLDPEEKIDDGSASPRSSQMYTCTLVEVPQGAPGTSDPIEAVRGRNDKAFIVKKDDFNAFCCPPKLDDNIEEGLAIGHEGNSIKSGLNIPPFHRKLDNDFRRMENSARAPENLRDARETQNVYDNAGSYNKNFNKSRDDRTPVKTLTERGKVTILTILIMELKLPEQKLIPTKIIFVQEIFQGKEFFSERKFFSESSWEPKRFPSSKEISSKNLVQTVNISPQVGARLLMLHRKWTKITGDQRVLETLLAGLKLEFMSHPCFNIKETGVPRYGTHELVILTEISVLLEKML